MILLAVSLWLVSGGRDQAPDALPVPGERDTIAVEVLNTTDIDGLAREVTRRLRRAGLDVVSTGSDRAAPVESTLILVRRGDLTAGERIRTALGLGQVRMAADGRLLLDVSVLLGPDAVAALRVHP
ncbi:MAG TPA: LytR C-terminal domain-containing protein [Gemmatimonadales bacterium]|nr:LytR C-terminal domain-containing protein [Gemmatimonadales bacterium]